jgi:hypothetical protein
MLEQADSDLVGFFDEMRDSLIPHNNNHQKRGPEESHSSSSSNGSVTLCLGVSLSVTGQWNAPL